VIFDVLRDFLGDAWQAEALPDDGLLVFGVSGDNGSWTAVAQAREDARQVAFYSAAPEHVPEEQRGEAALLLARLNWGLPIGAFELDVDDGQVRFRTSIDVGDGELTPELLKPLLIANLTLMDHHLPAIRAVAAGASAVEALAARDRG
jgi:hypothetical protein